MYNLFLDDVRVPRDAAEYVTPRRVGMLYVQRRWRIVRSYDEFVAEISIAGMPGMVSFDHDLTPQHFALAPGLGLSFYDEFKVKTGYHACKWMCRELIAKNLPPPRVLCHSINSYGKANIASLWAATKLLL